MSPGAQSALELIVAKCKEVAQDYARVEKEEIENKKQSEELLKQPGIYVYSYPHYLKHPCIEAEDGVTNMRTMMKVGISGANAKKRVLGQTAAMPESPAILYLFTEGERGEESTNSDADRLGKIEEQIHNHLEAIGHTRKRDAGGGTEWFLTNKETLASTAKLIGLDITFDHDSDGEA